MSVLKTAADRLRGNWDQGNFLNEETQGVCLMGAVRYSLWSDEFYDMAEMGDNDLSCEWPATYDTYLSMAGLLNEVITEQYPDFEWDHRPESIVERCVQWNDHPTTTEDEVLSILEKASAKEEEHDA